MYHKIQSVKAVRVMAILLSAVLTFAGLAFSSEVTAKEAEGSAKMGTIEEIIASYYDPDGRPMSCAHRAITYIGNPIPENSLAAIQDCIDHKVDIVELDIARTEDGVFVLSHDDSIKRTTTYTGSELISEMTYNEICEYPLLQYIGGSSGVYYDENGKTLVMPTFEQALALCKDKVMINLDKFTDLWSYRMELYAIVREYDCVDSVIFKGDYDSDLIRRWHKQIKTEYGEDAELPNFCTLNSNSDEEKFINFIKSHYDASTAFAVETTFGDYSRPQADPLVLEQVRKYARTFVNVLTDTHGKTGYCAGNKENSTGWAELIDLGYNILHTNNSADLAAYIYANAEPVRDVAKGIDTLYFSGYKHDKTDYTIKIEDSSVRLYDGDYIYFENVDFSSAKESIIADIVAETATGQLVIRADSENGKVIAKYDLSMLPLRALSVVEEIKSDSLGICDLYVCAENMGDGSVLISKLTCAEPKDGKNLYVCGGYVFTRPGQAPTLPRTVTVTNEYGFAYTSEVKWQAIPEACYEKNLSFFNVPGILKETHEKIYATVTVLDLDMSAAARWYDSGVGVQTNGADEVIAWHDRISPYSATATETKAPLYRSGVITFDGVDDGMMYEHSLSGKSDITMIINAKTDKNSTDYLKDYTINNSARYTLLQYPESGSWGCVWLTSFKDGIACRFGSGLSGNRGIYYNGVTVDGWNTVSAVKNGESEKLYLNSSMIYDRASDASAQYCVGSAGGTVENTHEYAYIGYGIQSKRNYYYNGSVSDIVIFERALSDSEMAMLSEYFSAKNQGKLKDTSDGIQSDFGDIDSFFTEETVTEIKLTIDSLTGYVNGESKALDAAPIIRNSRTMLPVRFVAENLGATVGWDDATKTVTIKRDATVIEIVIGSNVARVDGKDIALDSPAFIENSRTYLPVRVVAENLGAEVSWDDATKTATLTK